MKIQFVGDVHGDIGEFRLFVEEHSDDFFILTGDIIDYGPENVKTFWLFYDLWKANQAISVLGNHEHKFLKYIQQYREGNIRIKTTGGIEKTISETESLSAQDRERFFDAFIEVFSAAPHIITVNEKYVIAHAAIHPKFWNTKIFNRKVRNLALFGELDRENPFQENGFPNRRYGWAEHVPKDKIVLFGHDVITDRTIKPNVIPLDGGSGKGGTFKTYEVNAENLSIRLDN